MCGRIEPPRVVLESERPENPLRERALGVGREVPVQERRVDLGRRGDDLGERGPQDGEDLPHLRRQHPRLVVVEQRRVRAVRPFEALDVAALEVDVRAQVGEERREVARPTRLDPGVMTASRRASHLLAKGRRNAPGLLPVAPRDPDEAALVRVVLQRLDDRLSGVEQPADLVVDEALVRNPSQRGQLVGARIGPPRGHRDALLPSEHAGSTPEVGALGQPDAQLVEGAAHGRDVSCALHLHE